MELTAFVDAVTSFDVQFDDRKVPTELIREWQSKEVSALGARESHGLAAVVAPALDRVTRSTALKVCAQLSNSLRRCQKTDTLWFAAVQLFDLGNDNLGQVGQGQILVRALAACALCFSMDGGYEARPIVEATITSHCATISQLTGHAITMKDVHEETRHIFAKLSSCTTLPSVADWVSMFMDRLDVVTSFVFASQLKDLKVSMLTLAEWFAYHTPTSQRHRPRDQALGIFSAVLAGVGFISPSYLQPQGVEATEQLAAAVAAIARLTRARAHGPVAAVSLDMLEIVSGAPATEIRSVAHCTLTGFIMMASQGAARAQRAAA